MSNRDLLSIIDSFEDEDLKNIDPKDLNFDSNDVIKLLSKDESLQKPKSLIYSFFQKIINSKIFFSLLRK